ncbi:hypothetical protein BDR04DRAFT_1123887, partial [Suillus decipiens]
MDEESDNLYGFGQEVIRDVVLDSISELLLPLRHYGPYASVKRKVLDMVGAAIVIKHNTSAAQFLNVVVNVDFTLWPTSRKLLTQTLNLPDLSNTTPVPSQNGLAVPNQREQQSLPGLTYMPMQGGNRPSQEFAAAYPNNGQQQQWQINHAHQDAHCQNMWVPRTRENQHIIQPQQPHQQQHVQNCEDDGACSLLGAKELQKSIQETKNDSPKNNAKPQKDRYQNTSETVCFSKSVEMKEYSEIKAKLEDQGNWSDEDMKLLLETLLGSDSQLYEKLMVNAKYVYKK